MLVLTNRNTSTTHVLENAKLCDKSWEFIMCQRIRYPHTTYTPRTASIVSTSPIYYDTFVTNACAINVPRQQRRERNGGNMKYIRKETTHFRSSTYCICIKYKTTLALHKNHTPDFTIYISTNPKDAYESPDVSITKQTPKLLLKEVVQATSRNTIACSTNPTTRVCARGKLKVSKPPMEPQQKEQHQLPKEQQ